MLISKANTVAKLFFLLSFMGLLMYIILAFYTYHTAYLSSYRIKSNYNSNKIYYRIKSNYNSNKIYFDHELDTIESRHEQDLKYVLIYTKTKQSYRQYQSLKEGQYHFVKQRCPHFNCYLTLKKHLLNGDIRNFDAVVINQEDLLERRSPELRSSRQKYIFHSVSPPDQKILCRDDVDHYFNWTWSYRLSSDILSPYFVVKDIKKDKVVAPHPDVEWYSDLETTFLKGDEISKLKRKKKAVAAVVRNCNAKGGKFYAKKLRTALKTYSLGLDILGCEMACMDNTENGCDSAIDSDYFFVLVQEQSLNEDFLTDKVLKAYWNNAVPLIRSAGNLTKFLPTGSYVNVRYYSMEKIAAMVNYIIKNPSVYYSYFRWQKFYTFHKSEEFRGVCDLCALLNDEKRVNEQRSYDRFREWWFSGPINETLCMNKTLGNFTEWDANFTFIGNAKKSFL